MQIQEEAKVLVLLRWLMQRLRQMQLLLSTVLKSKVAQSMLPKLKAMALVAAVAVNVAAAAVVAVIALVAVAAVTAAVIVVAVAAVVTAAAVIVVAVAAAVHAAATVAVEIVVVAVVETEEEDNSFKVSLDQFHWAIIS
jgi:hypothetical protein